MMKTLGQVVGLVYLATILSGTALQADAAPVSPTFSQAMSYEVYLGGMNALIADVSLKDTSRDYGIHITAHTKGMVGAMVPWHGAYETQGRRVDGHILPLTYTSESTWQDRTTKMDYRFDRNGLLQNLKIMDAGKDKTPDSLDQNLIKDTVDVLTAALKIMESMPVTHTCQGTSDVFDGRRRYQLTFTSEGSEALPGSSINMYQGIAARCHIEVKPVAGKWPKKPRGWLALQEQSRQHGSLPLLWMAQMTSEMPAIPVKIQAQTNYGLLLIHLTKYDFLKENN